MQTRLSMNHRLLLVGKPALSFAAAGLDDYLRRLRRYGQYTLESLKDGPAEKVSQKLIEASAGTFRVVLDERGLQLTTRQFAEIIQQWSLHPAIKTVSYLIGPSDGHLPTTREAADQLLALSPLTLQHEFAALLLAEQLYRVATIHAGTPYHRG